MVQSDQLEGNSLTPLARPLDVVQRPRSYGVVAATPSCSLCGRVADPQADGDPPLTWCADIVEDLDGPRTRWVCDTCTRRYVRSIEAKLDQEWW